MPRLEYFKNREDFNKWYSEYRKKAKWKKYRTEYNREWRKVNTTFKDRVRLKVWYALKKGVLKKGKCEDCDNPKVEAHHRDYGKPMEVIWLCRPHHREADVLEGKRED